MGQHKSDEYGRRVCQAVRLLAEGRQPDEVALEVGVRQQTMQVWMDDAEFGTLVDCLRAFGHLQFSREAVETLRPQALSTLRRVLQDGSGSAATQAAREVLKWAREFEKQDLEAAKTQEKHTIRVVWDTPDGKSPFPRPWAERNPVTPRDWAAGDEDEERFPRRG